VFSTSALLLASVLNGANLAQENPKYGRQMLLNHIHLSAPSYSIFRRRVTEIGQNRLIRLAPSPESSTQSAREFRSSWPSCRDTYSSTASMFRPKNCTSVSTTTGYGRTSLTRIPICGSFCRIQSISRFTINCATVRDGVTIAAKDHVGLLGVLTASQ
jgi:hypothetical protein